MKTLTPKPKTTRLFLLFFIHFFTICFLSLAVSAQGYYEVKYEFYGYDDQHNQVYYEPIYHALLIDYGSDESVMRVRYSLDGGTTYRVIQQKIHSYQQTFDNDDGTSEDGWVYRGYDVTSVEGSAEGYIPDVIVLKADGDYYEPDFVFATDENDSTYFGEVLSFKALKVANITNDYLGDFGWRWEEETEEEFDLSSATLHLVLATASEDVELSSAFDKNHKRIKALFRSATNVAGMKFKSYEVKGNNFNKESITSKIQSLNVSQENDIVIFYYSGHGFRYDDQSTQWPQLALTYTVGIDFSDPANSAHTYNLQDIYNLLEQKNARLTIVIGECCNAGAGFTTPVAPDYPRIAPSGFPFNKNSLQSLFSSQGEVMIATAGPSQYSMYYPESGGYFCNSFYKSFMTQTGKGFTGSNMSWETILHSAMTTTKQIAENDNDASKNQVPIYKINIE